MPIYPNTSTQQQNFRRIHRKQATVTRARNVISPLAAANMAALAYRAPNLDAGQVAGLGITLPADDPAIQFAADEMMRQHAVDLNQPEGWFDNNIYDPFKGILRTGFTLLGGLME